METVPRDGRVRVLPPETAKKIAAGEVVDRPAALIRELVDNALDAGAASVEVSVEGGGALRAEVVDDGRGMEREDLELCWRPHATSKIYSEDDLLTAATLGFRGEALSSVSAVARLEIVSASSSGEAWALYVGPGESGAAAPRVERSRRARGTTVRVSGLFDAFPARKKFLKRDAAEAALCKQALLDKALAFPEVSFRFVQDGELKLFLPATGSLRERFAAALIADAGSSFVHEIATSGEGFSLSIVVGGPELSRGDRRLQYVLANGRRIQDFGLQQALEYGTQGWFSNGGHPVGAVCLSIDPALADFNIHPAKREARFKDPQAIHRAATIALRDFMRRRGIAEATRAASDDGGRGEARATPLFEGRDFVRDAEADYRGGGNAYPRPAWSGPAWSGPAWSGAGGGAAGCSGGYSGGAAGCSDAGASRAALEALLDAPPDFARPPRLPPAAAGSGMEPGEEGASAGAVSAPGSAVGPGSAAAARPRLVGTAFGFFLVVERGEGLYLIDQHAAHERLLYDKMRAAPPSRQELLVPYPFSTESEAEDAFLASRREELEALGIGVERDGAEGWQLTALPAGWGPADARAVRELLDLKSAGADLAARSHAGAACRAAAKEGDYLDEETALALAEAALDLPEPRCPHGRPIWVEMSLKDLLKAVQRL